MATPERPKLVISLDDLDDAPPAAPAMPSPPPAPAGPVFPTVDGIRRPPAQIGPLPNAGRPAGTATALASATPAFALGSVRNRNLVAALVGIVAGWLVTEVLGIAEWPATSQAGLNFHAAIWVAVLGFCFSVIYVGWEHIEARNAEGILIAARTAGPWGAGLGFVSGFLANAIFHSLVMHALESGSHASLYLARILGWGIFGVGMGVTTAALVRAREKLVNGAIGGVVGGAIGGLIFEYVGEHVDSGTFSRLVGLAVIGAGIGLAIGLVETLRRESWFQIVGGGMSGKEFVLYEGETKVGSSPKCEITLIKDPGVQPFHFVIAGTDAGPRRTLTAYDGCALTINGTPVVQHQLRNGDRIGVGATTIAYVERTI